MARTAWLWQDWTTLRIRLGASLGLIVPAWLVRAGIPPRRVRTVRVAELPLGAVARGEVSRAVQRGAPVEVALDADLFLRKVIAIPAAARGAALGAISVQLRQTLPSQAEGLVWRARYLRKRGSHAEYDVFILKQDRLTGLLRDAGTEVRRVVIDGVDEVLPLIDNRRAVDRPERFWNRATAALCGLALLAVLAAQAWQINALGIEEDTKKEEVAALREQAIAARAAVEARDAVAADQLRDQAMLRADSQRLIQLADLTEALDDSAWLTSAAFDGDLLRLAGFTNSDVAALVGAVQALSWVSSVTAEGSIVVDSSTGEGRFQLTVVRRTEIGQ